jgi:hypothetical protein
VLQTLVEPPTYAALPALTSSWSNTTQHPDGGIAV